MATMIASLLVSAGMTGATAAGVAGTISTVGTVLSMGGQIVEGNNANKIAQYQAKQADKLALEHQAQGIKEGQEKLRHGELLLSRARAVGAASGGGLDLDLMGDIAEEAQLQGSTAIWQGNQRADNTCQQAAETRFSGKRKKQASRYAAAGTMIGGANTLYDNYGF